VSGGPSEGSYHNDASLDYKEAAIMVLGTICSHEGCMAVVHPHSQTLLQFLLPLIDHESPLIKATTIYTCSKFASWVSEQDPDSFNHFLGQLLGKFQDADRNVKEQACNAVSYLMRNVDPDAITTEHALLIIQIFFQVCVSFTGAPLISFFDCLSAFAENLSQHCNNQQILQPLMQILGKKWSEV